MNIPRLHEYEAMGTHWKITILDDITLETFTALIIEIEEKTKQFDEMFSRFKKTSFVWAIAEVKGIVEVPHEFMEMLTWYMKIYEPSNKKINPSVGYALSDTGYDAEYSLKARDVIRRVPDLFESVNIIDATHIELHEKILFDFGALGKGYFVDVIQHLLQRKGLNHFLVDGSGDIFYEGNGESIAVGLEHPEDATKIIGVTHMKHGAMASSGIYKRSWGEYHHYLDPHALVSPRDIIAVWVLADSAVVADMVASALFFVPPENILDAGISFEYCILNHEYKVKKSEGFSVELY